MDYELLSGKNFKSRLVAKLQLLKSRKNISSWHSWHVHNISAKNEDCNQTYDGRQFVMSTFAKSRTWPNSS